MKKSKLLALLLALALCCATLAGCGGDSSGDTNNNADASAPPASGETDTSAPAADGADSEFKIGVVVKTMGNPLFREVAYGGVLAGEAFGCEVIPLATQQEGQIQEQIQI